LFSPVPDFAAERLVRQLAYLASLTDEEFLFAAGDVLRSLEADLQFAAHIEDLCHEADDLGKELQADEYDGGNPGQMLGHIWEDLRRRLTGPQHEALIAANSEFHAIFGSFDHPVMVPLDPNGGREDAGRVGRMLHLLDELGADDALEQDRLALARIREHQQKAHRRMLRLTRTHAGVALLRLRCLTEMDQSDGFRQQADSCPRSSEDRPSLVVSVTAGERRWDGMLDQLLAGGKELGDWGSAPAFVSVIRGAVARLGIELEERVGSVRSRVALIDRYKARCEWHDRERLFDLAEQASGKRESVLRDDLARWLFDQGLNPISEARLGAHARGDIFHPDALDSFLLEAKQYSVGAGLKSALQAAFRQTLETAGKLRGSGFAADEAFVALFRRGGPRALLPTTPVDADGLRWYFFLINIAPSDADASKSSETPVEYTVDELRALLFEARAAASAV
jgi:hypothetical protein